MKTKPKELHKMVLKTRALCKALDEVEADYIRGFYLEGALYQLANNEPDLHRAVGAMSIALARLMNNHKLSSDK